jgi:hypothetical protein
MRMMPPAHDVAHFRYDLEVGAPDCHDDAWRVPPSTLANRPKPA